MASFFHYIFNIIFFTCYISADIFNSLYEWIIITNIKLYEIHILKIMIVTF
jgi:hypothetical protein